jgi:transcriptional regulator with XRE-family HTH domain
LTDSQRIHIQIAHYLRTFRKVNNMNQDALAHRLGLSKTTICEYEDPKSENRIRNSLITLEKISNLSGSNISDFIGRLGDRNRIDSPWKKVLFSFFDNLTTRNQTKFISFLKKCHHDEINLLLEAFIKLAYLPNEKLETVTRLIDLL